MFDLKNKIIYNKNNQEKSSATKVAEHIPCVYTMSKIWIFDDIENKHDICRVKNLINSFCESLKELIAKKLTLKKENDTINKQRA